MKKNFLEDRKFDTPRYFIRIGNFKLKILISNLKL